MARGRRGNVMSIEALQSAANAAGYVMVAEDDSDVDQVFAVTEQTVKPTTGTALTVYAAEPAGYGYRYSPAQFSAQVHAAWAWVTSRWASGAPA